MQAKHGRAGKHKRYQLAAVLALTVLLIILLAGRVLPVCAGKNVPVGASLKQAKPGQTLCFPLETTAWRVSDPYGWRKDPFTGKDTFHQGVDLACAEGTTVRAVLDGVVTMAAAVRPTATICAFLIRTGRKRSMPTCSISMSGPGRWLQQASGWALPDRRAVPPGHTCTLNF